MSLAHVCDNNAAPFATRTLHFYKQLTCCPVSLLNAERSTVWCSCRDRSFAASEVFVLKTGDFLEDLIEMLCAQERTNHFGRVPVLAVHGIVQLPHLFLGDFPGKFTERFPNRRMAHQSLASNDG